MHGLNMHKIVDWLGRPVKTLAQYKELGGEVTVLESEKLDTYRVRAWRSKTGHVEGSAQRNVGWYEVEWPVKRIRQFLKRCEADAICPIEIARRKKASLDVACKRAKKRVRQACKAQGMDTLLTLTYRALVVDLGLVKRHLREFHRRVTRVLPTFKLIACFEKQQRGAWHVHMATRSIPRELAARNGVMVKSYNVIRAIWRAVVGELGGNIDVSRRKRNSRRSAASIAGYIAKYIAKDFSEVEKWANRYTTYGLEKADDADRVEGDVDNLNDAIGVLYAMIAESDKVLFMRLTEYQDVFCLFAEPPA